MKKDIDLSPVHPAILQCMTQYHRVFNMKVSLGSRANIEMKDLPTLDEFTGSNEKSTLCLNWCLSICAYAKKVNCHFMRRHVAKEKITSTFDSKLCQLIGTRGSTCANARIQGAGTATEETQKLGMNPGLWGCWAMCN